jgi:spore coat protein A, manganese oxidase
MKKKFTRRELLELGAIAGSSLLLPTLLQSRGYAITAGSPQPTRFQVELPIPPVLKPVRSDTTTDYYEVAMNKSLVDILPGLKTEVWAYNGRIPGSTIVQRQDRKSVVRFINNLDTPTSVHLHGMASLPQYDGYPEDLIAPGYYKDYLYPNTRASTLWYHDHAIHNTARNVYMGLAGMYIVQDQLELDLPLPKGKYDVPLIIQDKIFASNGSLIFDHDNHKGVMGDVILVNGAPWPKMKVAKRKYRFRVLNASTSRSYKLALSNGDDLIVIGSDGGLLGAPVRTKDLRMGMAERYDFIIDFSRYDIGSNVILQNLGLPNNKDYDGTSEIVRFDVISQESDPSSIPDTLRPFEPLLRSSAVRERRWTFEHRDDMWKINGNTWDKNRVDANPGLNDTEIWTFIANSRDWFHPVHVHLIDFQILERNRQPPLPYEQGWKDVVYNGEDDNIQIIARFKPNPGKYIIHCHNTVHEDYDMMTQYQIGQGGEDPLSAPAKPLPAPKL